MNTATEAEQPYKRIWGMLFVGWVFAYFDRTITGPVVSWMIANDVAFLADSSNPYALGGLLGSLFFAGYMLTQFPGGYFGDKYGHRNMVILSLLWAGITTVMTGLFEGLLVFIALRVLTGLGEGAFYSNDRSLIAQVTPPKKLGLGMGIVMGGLSVGLTLGLVGTVYLIEWAVPIMGNNAWKSPFLLLGASTIIVAIVMSRVIPKSADAKAKPDGFKNSVKGLGSYSIIFLIIIMGVYIITDALGLSEGLIAAIFTVFSIGFVFYIYKTKKEVRPVLKNRNLFLLYLSAIPIMWHLWFYSFWSVSIVQDFGGGTLLTAALVASFNAIAGLIGFPLGGYISDKVASIENGRRNILFILTVAFAASVFIFAFYLMSGASSLAVMSTILFISGTLFFAVQSIQHAFISDLAPAEHRGSAFGLWNLIAEFGALLSPVISGVLRDRTESWSAPLLLDGALIAASCICIILISTRARKRVKASEPVTAQ
ncbi:MFS transporter [Lysinibacillus yapensis]|uniref:MFS transporter n=1 Tax=Ureibacillus yapensis TaxID=2304605 RepID=A0A396SNY0_9BACL|nr:MFS transporter [Lysinibacillus yapensis]RHW37550.1 MFS transporter [Lysinibacillus yapensis]